MSIMPEPITLAFAATLICLIFAICWCAVTEDRQATVPASATVPAGEVRIAQSADRRSPSCPDWCVVNHRWDETDEVNDLVLHEAAPMAYGIRLARTDCPDEGRVGTPVLHVALELELATWEDASRLAHAVLDGVDFLTGAEL